MRVSAHHACYFFREACSQFKGNRGSEAKAMEEDGLALLPL